MIDEAIRGSAAEIFILLIIVVVLMATISCRLWGVEPQVAGSSPFMSPKTRHKSSLATGSKGTDLES